MWGRKAVRNEIVLQTLLFFTVKSKDASKASKGIPVDDPAASENAKLKWSNTSNPFADPHSSLSFLVVLLCLASFNLSQYANHHEPDGEDSLVNTS